MDPATVGGIAIGTVSLIFDVFDNSVKCKPLYPTLAIANLTVFRFLSSMVEMPKDCERLRLMLTIEYNRFLAWGKAIGLLDIQQGMTVADNLGTNAVELCGIIARIGWLLGEFRDMNARWKNEMIAVQAYETADTKVSTSLSFGNPSTLEVQYNSTGKDRKQIRRSERVVQWMSRKAGDAKEIITNPGRIRWVMVDKEAFSALLQDLHDLNERLHQLADDKRWNQINEITADTYRYLVLTRNDISELRDMLGAIVTLVQQRNLATSAKQPPERVELELELDLCRLLRLKQINQSANDLVAKLENGASIDVEDSLQGLITVPGFNSSILEGFTYANADEELHAPRLNRVRGRLKTEDKEMEAWIEWRDSTDARQLMQDSVAKVRVITLAEMLHSAKPKDLLAPSCLGYIDDTMENARYGWIFAMPNGSSETTSVRELHSILGQAQYRPSLTTRITLAWKLAASLQYLHTADWLHKGVHSGNVVFTFENELFDATNPILVGFEYSRPQTGRTTGRSTEAKWDIYRWPGVQNDLPRAKGYHKAYDIYSLGLLFLEIAYWKPLNQILRLKNWPQRSRQDSRIRGWLLETDDSPPFDLNPITELRDIVGDKYWNVVKQCVSIFGMDELQLQQNSGQSGHTDKDADLHNAFNQLVVQQLKNVSV